MGKEANQRPANCGLHLALAVGLFSIWTIASLFTRPPVPVDETRYLSVAWEMHETGAYLVPHKNGEIYGHKPPLLFWLINLAWSVLGVHESVARSVGPLLGVVVLFLTFRLGRKLWPDHPEVATWGSLMLASGAVWAAFSSLTMFDTGLTCAVLAALIGWLRILRGEPLAAWILGIALGVGALQKGPVVGLYTLPVVMCSALWSETVISRRHVATFAGSLVIGGLVFLAWLIPAALIGGQTYIDAMFWQQSVGRVVQSFDHQRPVWWYVLFFPVALFPWGWTWQPWIQFPATWKETGIRFCAISIATALGLLSIVSGKQLHYLLPLLPAASLILARLILTMPTNYLRALVWQTSGLHLVVAVTAGVFPLVARQSDHLLVFRSMSSVWSLPFLGIAACVLTLRGVTRNWIVPGLAASLMATYTLAQVMAFRELGGGFDIRPFAQAISRAQQEGHEIGFFGTYDGQFQFAGRLSSPIAELPTEAELYAWAQAHPEGYVIFAEQPTRRPNAGLVVSRPYLRDLKPHQLELWRADVIRPEGATTENSPTPNAKHTD